MNIVFLFLFIDAMVQRFNRSGFASYESTYSAAESVIAELKASGKFNSYYVKKYNAEFLYSPEALTAVLLKYIVKCSKKAFVAKKNRSYQNPNEETITITTSSVGRNLINHFMHHPDFPQYELVVSVGSHLHEGCVFFRTHKRSMEAIYYNPNYSNRTKGVQSSKTASELLRSIGITKIKAFHSKYGNPEGKCSLLTWELIFDFIQNGNSPFDNDQLNLIDYNHLMTPQSYIKFFSLNGKIGGLKHFRIWKKMDKVLNKKKANMMDKLRIMNLMISVISNHCPL